MAKLLLVEDDNNLREIYEARLSAEGYDITTAQNGEEALSVAKSVHPDLIISDVMMPRISGFEMLDILRNTDELKNTKIIMLTALGQSEDRGRADNLGADRYLVKSQVTLEDIVKAAQELLTDEAAVTAPVTAVEPAVTVPASPVAEDTTPVSPEPVQPVAVEPVANTAPVTTYSPVAEPETDVVTEPVVPTSAPITEPAVTTTSATVPDPVVATPVQVPDPVVPEPTEIENSPVPAAAVATTVTVPDTDPIAVTPPQVETPDLQPAVTAPTENSIPSSSQTLAAEEEAIEQQIASFAEAPEQPTQQPQVGTVTTPTVITPTPESVANDAVLAQAMTDLTSTSAPVVAQPELTTNVEPVPAPNPAPEAAPAPAPTPQPDATIDTIGASQQVTGHKTIQPLDGTANAGTTDLEALLAAEDAKESAAPALQTTAAMAEPPKPAIDPNTIAL